MTGEIVWYPGHMAKAKRKIAEVLPLIDAVIELIDARLPISSRNPDFQSLFQNKPSLALLTKAGLAEDAESARFAREIAGAGTPCLVIDCKENPDMKRVTAEIRKLLSEKFARDAKRGIKRPARLLVAGITNVGKSTFINTYTKTKKAKTADRPGVTRENAWIKSPYGVELLDTPGLLWHKFEDRETAVKLSAVGSIRDEILDLETLALETLKIIRGKYLPLLEKRYHITADETVSEAALLKAIGKSRGFLARGGEIDTLRAAAVFFDELRGGKIGKMTLDSAKP